MSIADVLARRGISEIVHFTTNRGLVGMLATEAVSSRRRLPEQKYLQHILHPNCISRVEDSSYFDKNNDWLDCVNLSLSEINTSFFRFSKAWPHNQDIWWVILSFGPEIATHEGVFFATTNNSYEHCCRGVGSSGLKALFAASVRRKRSWVAYRHGRGNHLPTCEQAEVLYPVGVHLRFLRRVYVNAADESDRVRGWLREFEWDGVEVIHHPEKFAGAPN